MECSLSDPGASLTEIGFCCGNAVYGLPPDVGSLLPHQLAPRLLRHQLCMHAAWDAWCTLQRPGVHTGNLLHFQLATTPAAASSLRGRGVVTPGRGSSEACALLPGLLPQHSSTCSRGASSCAQQSRPQAWLPDAALEAAAATSAAARAAACAPSATNFRSSGSHTYIVPSSSSNCCSSGGGISALQPTDSVRHQAGLQPNNGPASCRSCQLSQAAADVIEQPC